jgi:hypothetical protein
MTLTIKQKRAVRVSNPVLTVLSLVVSILLCLSSMSLRASAATSHFFPSWLRYRMTVRVETPEGIRTGSAVRKVELSSFFSYYKVLGEAVVVDLGKRGVLFALMENTYGSVDYAYNVALTAFPMGDRTPIGTTVVLKPDSYPRFVEFKDLQDPTTVQTVIDGAHKINRADRCCRLGADHTEELFGKGVKIKEVDIEVTDAPVTWVIENWLPWLNVGNIRKFHCGNAPCNPNLPLFPNSAHVSPMGFQRNSG